MREITLEYFMEQEVKRPGRRCFAQTPGMQVAKKAGKTPSFNVKFYEGVGLVLEAMTGLKLISGNQPDNFYCYLRTQEQVAQAQLWEQSQGTRVYLRDCLPCSIALDHNKIPESDPQQYTEIGLLEHNAKQNGDKDAIAALAAHFIDAIKSLPPYNEAKVIAAVPARTDKAFDLPTTLAEQIAQQLTIDNVTSLFCYAGDKGQLKATKYEERWSQLTNAKLGMKGEAREKLKDQAVILIDDKYQSGVTANYVAMVLQQHGARNVYGLYAVKTWGDKDNL